MLLLEIISFEIPSDHLIHSRCTIYLGEFDGVRKYQDYSTEAIEAFSEPSEDYRRYIGECIAFGNVIFLYHKVPHILSLDSICVRGLKVVKTVYAQALD